MKKRLNKKQMWLFASGQLGWSLLSGLITTWVVNFYQPSAQYINDGLSPLIPQGAVILGIFTIIGVITAFCRVFDAVTDPVIASASDRSTNKNGRRLPFMKKIALPLAAVTFLVFMVPNNEPTVLNVVWLFLTLVIYYVCITIYCTPFNALISEFADNQKDRLRLSTYVSLTFFIGTAIASVVPNIVSIFQGAGVETIAAYRITFAILCVLALIFLLIPPFTLKETDFVDVTPSKTKTFSSLKQTFKNRNFRTFVFSDVFYWISLTIFQTGLTYFVVELMNFDKNFYSVLFIGMSVLSVCFYPLVGVISKKFGKKKLIIAAFFTLSICFVLTAVSRGGSAGHPSALSYLFAFAIIIIAAFPMAILGILPQAIVADVAQYESIETGEKRQGMFFAARTFTMKLGQSIAMVLFTSVSVISFVSHTGESEVTTTGLRIAAVIAFVFCVLGGVILMRYKEKDIMKVLKKAEEAENEN